MTTTHPLPDPHAQTTRIHIFEPKTHTRIRTLKTPACLNGTETHKHALSQKKKVRTHSIIDLFP